MEERKNAGLPAEQGDTDEIDLLELASNFFRIARRVWWLFVVLVAGGIVAVYAFSYASYSPMYRCEATFTISTGDDSSFYYSVDTAGQLSKTFPYILDSGYLQRVAGCPGHRQPQRHHHRPDH